MTMCTPPTPPHQLSQEETPLQMYDHWILLIRTFACCTAFITHKRLNMCKERKDCLAEGKRFRSRHKEQRGCSISLPPPMKVQSMLGWHVENWRLTDLQICSWQQVIKLSTKLCFKKCHFKVLPLRWSISNGGTAVSYVRRHFQIQPGRPEGSEPEGSAGSRQRFSGQTQCGSVCRLTDCPSVRQPESTSSSVRRSGCVTYS